MKIINMQVLSFSQNIIVVRLAGRSWEQSRILCMHPAHSTTNGVGKPPNLPSTTQPLDPHLTPYKKPAHPTLTPREWAHEIVIFLPLHCSMSPNICLPEFLIWPHINFYWLGSPGTLDGISCNYSSVQFSRSVVPDSLWPHELQHTRPPCPSPTPGVYPNPCPSSRWCHPTISSCVIPFSSCPQSFPASGSFQMSQLFASGGPSIGVSASTSVLPMNTQDWSPLGWTGWISLQSKGLSRVFSNTSVQKHQFFGTQLSL